MKEFHFFSGLLRSGSHLLQSLLSQHPEVYVGSDSEGTIPYGSIKNRPDMIVDIYNEAYRDIDKRIIFDTNRLWGTDKTIPIMDKLNNKGILVFCHRPLEELAESWVTINKENGLNEILPHHYLDTPDVQSAIKCLKNNPKNIHMVSYDEMISNTIEVVNKIWTMVGVEKIDLDLDNIQRSNKEFFPFNSFHLVRGKISKLNRDITKELSHDKIKEYQEKDFWTRRLI